MKGKGIVKILHWITYSRVLNSILLKRFKSLTDVDVPSAKTQTAQRRAIRNRHFIFYKEESSIEHFLYSSLNSVAASANSLGLCSGFDRGASTLYRE